MRTWVLWLLCAPADLLGLGLAALLRALAWVPGFGTWWRWSVALGPHVVVLDEGAGPYTLVHENVHCEQATSAIVGWWIAGLVAAIVTLDVFTGLWFVYFSPFSWLVAYLGSGAAAWLQGRDAYTGNIMEQHARLAQVAAQFLDIELGDG